MRAEASNPNDEEEEDDGDNGVHGGANENNVDARVDGRSTKPRDKTKIPHFQNVRNNCFVNVILQIFRQFQMLPL